MTHNTFPKYRIAKTYEGYYVFSVTARGLEVHNDSLFGSRAQAQSFVNTLLADDAAWQWMMDVEAAQAPMELPA